MLFYVWVGEYSPQEDNWTDGTGSDRKREKLRRAELTRLARYYSVDVMGDTWGACGGEVKCVEECGGMY